MPPSFEEIGAGHVFVQRHAFDTVGEQVAGVPPFALECGRLGDGRPLAAEDRVAGVAFEPSEGVPRAVLPVVLVSLVRLGRDRVRVEFLPIVQVVVERHRHRVPHTVLVVAHGRDALPVDEAVAAVHPVQQSRRVVAPVEQIRARHVAPVVGPLAQPGVLEDVEQVVAPLPEDGAVRVERHRHAFRNHEVVAGPCRIAQDALTQLARVLGQPISLSGTGDGHATPGAVSLPRHPELEEAASRRRTQGDRVHDGRVSVDDHVGVVKDEPLVPIGRLVDLSSEVFPKVGLRHA